MNILDIIREIRLWRRNTTIHNRNALDAMAIITLVVIIHLLSKL